jgi:hypothetical protein
MHDSSSPDSTDVTPWPGWIRYTLLAVLFAVIGIGVVVALYDKGFLPIAGPFVVLFLLPILIPLRRRGLRNRTHRLGSRLDERLAALGPALERERSLASQDRASGASDSALAAAATRVDAARQALAAGQEPSAVATVDELARTVTAGWHRDAPVTRDVAEAASRAHQLERVLRQVGRAEAR